MSFGFDREIFTKRKTKMRYFNNLLCFDSKLLFQTKFLMYYFDYKISFNRHVTFIDAADAL